MRRYFYDLHIHSCLSPCGDDDSTPYNIAGMAKISGLDIVALTDHNTAKNCPAFFKACEGYGIVAVAGMELTTSEDIHAVCLFERLEDAMSFDEYVDKHRMKIKNREDIFGRQLILGEDDRLIGTEEYLLSNATDISIEDAKQIVASFGGICYPAHIDRDANGIIAVLGTFPSPSEFSIYELRDKENKDKYEELYSLADKMAIFSSDAHYLTDISDAENFFLLEESDSAELVRSRLFELLR